MISNIKISLFNVPASSGDCPGRHSPGHSRYYPLCCIPVAFGRRILAEGPDRDTTVRSEYQKI